MRCPNCGCRKSLCIDTRISEDGSKRFRRHECVSCKLRFNTTETVTEFDWIKTPEQAVKKEAMDRWAQKIIRLGILAEEKETTKAAVVE